MIIEDRLSFDDAPPPPRPTPAPSPVAPIAPPLELLASLKPDAAARNGAILQVMNLAVVVILAGVIAWQHFKGGSPAPGPTPSPTVDAIALGKEFTPKLAASLADAFDTAATMIAAGTSVTEADNALKTKFAAGRNEAFKALVAPEFAKILPEGQDPKDAATREAFAKIHRDFASGLRGAK